jgi:hypothetical protein
VRKSARLIAITALVAALAAPGSAAAWKYVFQDFFDTQGGAVGAGRAVAKKCGPGGKLGVYDYRSSVVASGQSFELEFEILARLSVRESWGKLKRVDVSYTATNYPADLAEQAAVALDEFHETIYTRYKERNKLLVRHGSLVMFGNEVVAPDEHKTKFKPKPGC